MSNIKIVKLTSNQKSHIGYTSNVKLYLKNIRRSIRNPATTGTNANYMRVFNADKIDMELLEEVSDLNTFITSYEKYLFNTENINNKLLYRSQNLTQYYKNYSNKKENKKNNNKK